MTTTTAAVPCRGRRLNRRRMTRSTRAPAGPSTVYRASGWPTGVTQPIGRSAGRPDTGSRHASEKCAMTRCETPSRHASRTSISTGRSSKSQRADASADANPNGSPRKTDGPAGSRWTASRYAGWRRSARPSALARAADARSTGVASAVARGVVTRSAGRRVVAPQGPSHPPPTRSLTLRYRYASVRATDCTSHWMQRRGGASLSWMWGRSPAARHRSPSPRP